MVPSHYGEFPLLETLTDPAQLELVAQVLGATGAAALPLEHRRVGPGSSHAMGSFLWPGASRFSNGDYALYYAADERATAIAETVYHHELERRRGDEDSARLTMRLIVCSVAGDVVDLRGLAASRAEIYSAEPDDYDAAQRLGAQLRLDGHEGVVYDSVRRPEGECAGLFRPDRVGDVVRTEELVYVYDGEQGRVVDVVDGAGSSVSI